MSRYFSQDLDTDHDGKLDLEELSIWIDPKNFVPGKDQRYTYRVLQTIQMKLILLCVWANLAVLGSTK